MLELSTVATSLLFGRSRSCAVLSARVSRFSNILTPDDLKPAYERAGMAFNGQLGQNFVVLNESDQEQFQGLGTSKPWSWGRSGGAGRGDRGGGRGGGTSGPVPTNTNLTGV